MNEMKSMSLETVVNKLGLSDLPLQHAYKVIADFVNSRKFDMYFDESIRGTTGYENKGKGLIHLGRKIACDISANDYDEEMVFLVHQYKYDNKCFFPTDPLATGTTLKEISASLVYFDKNQIEAFAKTSSLKKARGDQGLLKALALLARELADKGEAKYRTGNKVNALAFKKHIVDLAEHYDISDGLLKSLDDKVNDALVELDLKEIKPIPQQKNPT